MHNKKHHLAKWSILSDVLCILWHEQPLPPRLKRPFTYVVYVYSDISLSKGHLGSVRGGGKHLKKLKDINFIFTMTYVTVLSVLCTHAQKEYHKVLEMKSTSMLNILALLLLDN